MGFPRGFKLSIEVIGAIEAEKFRSTGIGAHITREGYALHPAKKRAGVTNRDRHQLASEVVARTSELLLWVTIDVKVVDAQVTQLAKRLTY